MRNENTLMSLHCSCMSSGLWTLLLVWVPDVLVPKTYQAFLCSCMPHMNSGTTGKDRRHSMGHFRLEFSNFQDNLKVVFYIFWAVCMEFLFLFCFCCCCCCCCVFFGGGGAKWKVPMVITHTSWDFLLLSSGMCRITSSTVSSGVKDFLKAGWKVKFHYNCFRMEC